MGWARAVLALVAVVAAGALLISGGSEADPQTPRGMPGMPPPFLGAAVIGDGGLTAAVDAYGNVVDLRAPGPAGRALIDNPAERQAAGTVPADTGIVPRVRLDDGSALPMWRAESVRQRYLPGTNAVRTVGRFGEARLVETAAARGQELALVLEAHTPGDLRPAISLGVQVEPGVRCRQEERGRRLGILCEVTGWRDRSSRRSREAILPLAAELIERSASADRRWLSRARALGSSAPPWAQRLYKRSLLVLRALTDRRTGAVAAGARDGWAYVWPRDAGAVALAFDAAGYRSEARRAVRFLLDLDLDAAARFYGDGEPVSGRGSQGDASGWVGVAARAVGLEPPPPLPWRDLPDYQEKEPGDYLGNAIAAADGTKREIRDDDGTKSAVYGAKSSRGLVRRSGDSESGLDSAAAWAVRPFSQPDLYPAARETLRRLVADRTRFGITPSEDWPGEDPWSAPTAWTAWSFAALGDRRRALQLMRALRRSATPAGALPERVDARTGVPRSTTPLAWSHAFAIMALQELWPTEAP